MCLPEVQGHQVDQHDLLVQARPNKEGYKEEEFKEVKKEVNIKYNKTLEVNTT